MKDGEPVISHIETGEIIPAHKAGDKWRIAQAQIVCFRRMFMDKPCPPWKLSDNNRSKNA